MQEAIKNFPKQFSYQPKIENKKYFKASKDFIVLGMGGSHLAADLLLAIKPEMNIHVHQDYGLPTWPLKKLKNYLIIANSYSGNTEEVIDGLNLALKNKLSVLVIAVGGKLINIAKAKNLPYIQMPNWHIQPRQALGLNARALLLAMSEHKLLKESSLLAKNLKAEKYKKAGKKMADQLFNRVPIIYASRQNTCLAFTWKIKFNENSKIPAFYNVFPELNHNEMTGFDSNEWSKKLSNNFSIIYLEDKSDHIRINKRFKTIKNLYKKEGLKQITIPLRGQNRWQEIFSSMLLADWASFYLAEKYHRDPNSVPMVEKFKKMI
ncbi:MAG: bifunctional phosphoglucose/phosphomannose isomerase [Patescibacteria group bacterium]